MNTERIAEAFFWNGLQYYISAWFAAQSGLMPVAGNLFHHAIEQFLKGGLSTSHSEPKLKKLGHDLNRLWASFKTSILGRDLTEFDDLITHLDPFEHIRYPQNLVNEGMFATVAWEASPSTEMVKSNSPDIPQYGVIVQEIDRLVRTLFDTCAKNPLHFIGGLNEHALEQLHFHNPSFPKSVKNK